MRIFRINTEKAVNGAVLFLAVLVIAAQVILTLPNFSRYLSIFDTGEAVFTDAEGIADKTADIVIHVGNLSGGEAFVLQNGVSVCVLSAGDNTVTVTDNSVIEIDARNAAQSFYVTVRCENKNVTTDFPEKIYVCSNIAMVGRIFIR